MFVQPDDVRPLHAPASFPRRPLSRLAGLRATGLAVLAVIAAVAASFWIRAGVPLHAIGSANHDDYHFIKLADALRKTHWLGAYDNLTLAKGMFYPLFIAIVSNLHVPLKIAEHAVTLIAAGGLAYLVYRLSRVRSLGVVLFVLLAFNPVLWTFDFSRALRDSLYIGLTLGLVTAFAALQAQLLLSAANRRRVFIIALAAGVLGAAYWLTREEGIWIIPALLVVAVFAVAAARIDHTAPPAAKPRRTRLALGATALGTAVAVALVGAVAWRNLAAYGVFTDVDFRARGFVSAYSALSSITPEAWQRFVVVPRDAREKAYGVSAAAATLRPALEGDLGGSWKSMGCAQQVSEPCSDIFGGAFVWALRDAAAAAGHYRDGAETEAFYRTVADEINAACAVEQLDCIPHRSGLAPRFRLSYVKDATLRSPEMLSALLRFGENEIRTAPSTGPENRLRTFDKLAGPIARDDETQPIARVAGWFAVAEGPPTIAVQDPQGNTAGRVEIFAAPDVEESLQERKLRALRFRVYPACPGDDCILAVTAPSGVTHRFPLTALVVTVDSKPDHVLAIENIARVKAAGTVSHTERVQPIARALSVAYARIMPALFATGCVGILIALCLLRRDPRALFLTGIAAAALTAVASRIALCAYLDVTTFPALSTLYLSTATPFLLVVAALGNGLGIAALADAQRRFVRQAQRP